MLYEQTLRRYFFTMDPEEAHVAAIRYLETLQSNPRLLRLVEWLYDAGNNPRPVKVAGITFPNRVGFAAGFDKNARVVPALQAFGFGFVEVGSVLPRPQEGNPRPRVFRLEEHEAVINRYGFNSDGMEKVHDNLKNLKFWRPRIRIPIGISLGKMKGTPNEKAAEDFLAVLDKLYYCGDYFVINVSSPNTPGLRDLQNPSNIEGLVRVHVHVAKVHARKSNEEPKPIFIKVAPDLSDEDLDGVVDAAIAGGVSGFIATNTLMKQEAKEKLGSTEAGGLSGRPIFPIALRKVRRIRKRTDLPIMGVGGIDSKERARKMFDAGADVVQVYTGVIYHGFGYVQDIRFLDRRK